MSKGYQNFTLVPQLLCLVESCVSFKYVITILPKHHDDWKQHSQNQLNIKNNVLQR